MPTSLFGRDSGTLRFVRQSLLRGSRKRALIIRYVDRGQRKELSMFPSPGKPAHRHVGYPDSQSTRTSFLRICARFYQAIKTECDKSRILMTYLGTWPSATSRSPNPEK